MGGKDPSLGERPNREKRKGMIRALPLVFGLSAFVISYFLIFPPSDVPQRSTAALGFLPIIVLVFISGLLGEIVARVIEYIATHRGEKFPEEKERAIEGSKRILSVGIILILIAITTSSVFSIINDPERELREQANVFGVKIDTGVIEKVDLINFPLQAHQNLLDCGSLFTELDYDENTRGFSGKSVLLLPDDKFELFATGGGYTIENVLTGQKIANNLNNYDYLRSVSLHPHQEPDTLYLFALADLRATSGRSLLTVYDLGNGDIVYEELLNRLGLNLVLGYGELADKTNAITVLNYNGEYSPDYEICTSGNEPQDDDFEIRVEAYRFKNSE